MTEEPWRMLQGTDPEHSLYIYAYLQYFSVIFNTKHSMPFVKKLITTLFINPCVHAIKHDLYSLIMKDAAMRHKYQVKMTFSHVCYIWLFRRSRVLILRQIFSSRLHLRRSFLWKNSFCIISLAFVCKLVRWGEGLCACAEGSASSRSVHLHSQQISLNDEGPRWTDQNDFPACFMLASAGLVQI